MPKARKKPKPVDHPMWTKFEEHLKETRGGLGDDWEAQWEAFRVGLKEGFLIGMDATVRSFLKQIGR